MQIIISPAKRMRSQIDFLTPQSQPFFLSQSAVLLEYLKTLTIKELQQMLKCNEQIAQVSYTNYQSMNLKEEGVPAIMSFDGIQYTYMRPDLFDDDQLAYATKHLFLLSAFYGVLRAMDGVMPYRLEFNHVFHTSFCDSLYAFWKDSLYQFLSRQDHDILDLSSKQCGNTIRRYQSRDVRIVTCYFYEEEHHTRKEKGVYVKMARGEMVRYLAAIQATSFAEVKQFKGLGYHFDERSSDDEHYVFVRSKSNEKGFIPV